MPHLIEADLAVEQCRDDKLRPIGDVVTQTRGIDDLRDAVLLKAKDPADFPIGLALRNERNTVPLALCDLDGTTAQGTTRAADLPSGIECEGAKDRKSTRLNSSH